MDEHIRATDIPERLQSRMTPQEKELYKLEQEVRKKRAGLAHLFWVGSFAVFVCCVRLLACSWCFFVRLCSQHWVFAVC
jgi:hypothetical protein